LFAVVCLRHVTLLLPVTVFACDYYVVTPFVITPVVHVRVRYCHLITLLTCVAFLPFDRTLLRCPPRYIVVVVCYNPDVVTVCYVDDADYDCVTLHVAVWLVAPVCCRWTLLPDCGLPHAPFVGYAPVGLA